MRLVVDTSALVGELLRSAGRARLDDARLELFVPQPMVEELSVELPRRIGAFVRRRGLPASVGDELVEACALVIATNVAQLAEPVYSAAEDEGRARAARDPSDWPMIASALALSAGIWTHDRDFFGCGVATWTSGVLQGWLDRHPDSDLAVS